MIFNLQIDDKKKYILAYSGGIDSTALAHILVTNYPSIDLRLLHIYPGSKKQISIDRYECINQFSKLLNVPIEIVYGNQSFPIDLLIHRQIKYESLKKIMCTDSIVMTAHHLEDQLNTVLFKIMRSNNPLNWSIKEWRSLGVGQLWRPLLSISKKQLISYVEKHKLQYFEDEDNFNLNFKRNILNIKVLPELLSVGSMQNFQKSLYMFKQHNKIVEYTVQKTYDQVKCPNGIDVNRLLLQPTFLYSEVIYYWLKNNYSIYPSGRILDNVVSVILKTNSSAKCYISLNIAERLLISNKHITLIRNGKMHNNS